MQLKNDIYSSISHLHQPAARGPNWAQKVCFSGSDSAVVERVCVRLCVWSFRINIVRVTHAAISHWCSSYITVAIPPVAPPTCSSSAHDDLVDFFFVDELRWCSYLSVKLLWTDWLKWKHAHSLADSSEYSWFCGVPQLAARALKSSLAALCWHADFMLTRSHLASRVCGSSTRRVSVVRLQTWTPVGARGKRKNEAGGVCANTWRAATPPPPLGTRRPSSHLLRVPNLHDITHWWVRSLLDWMSPSWLFGCQRRSYLDERAELETESGVSFWIWIKYLIVN